MIMSWGNIHYGLVVVLMDMVLLEELVEIQDLLCMLMLVMRGQHMVMVVAVVEMLLVVMVSQGGNGPGRVVVRYRIGDIRQELAKATGGNVSFYNGKVIHVFKVSPGSKYLWSTINS